MNSLPSPDIPAYLSYLLVLLVGMVVARVSVNTLVQFPDRWAFAGTWVLFFAYAGIPLALFYFLDYVGVIHDTSLFPALAVAVLYPQIFAGGVQGMILPGQTAALWQPFENWAERVKNRIQDKYLQYRNRFDEDSRTRIVANSGLLTDLETLVMERSNDVATLNQRLLPYRQEMEGNIPGAPRRLVEQLWRELRQQEPENYALLLRNRKLIPWWPYRRWFRKGQTQLVTAAMVVLGCVVGALLVAEWLEIGQNNPRPLIAYNLWRFERTGATDRDRDRSRAYLEEQLRKNYKNEKGEWVSRYAEDILDPLIARLRYKSTTADQTADILRFVRGTHSASADEAGIPALIQCARTESFDLRTRIHELLLDMAYDWSAYPVSRELKENMPAEGETTRQIEARVQQWLQWWASTKAPPPTKNPVESGLINDGKVDLPGLFFDTGKPAIRSGPESEIALKQVVDALSAHADWKLRVEGHTDNVGGKDFNLRLSQKRAESVVAALEQHGVAAGRLQAEGFGFSKPEAPNDTEDGRARNRRARLVKL